MFLNPVPPPPDSVSNDATMQDMGDTDLLFIREVDNDFDQMNLFSESGGCEEFSCGTAHCSAHLCIGHECKSFKCDTFEDQTEKPEPSETPDQT